MAISLSQSVSKSFRRFNLILLFGVDDIFGVNELSFAISFSETVSESSYKFSLIPLARVDGLIGLNEI